MNLLLIQPIFRVYTIYFHLSIRVFFAYILSITQIRYKLTLFFAKTFCIHFKFLISLNSPFWVKTIEYDIYFLLHIYMDFEISESEVSNLSVGRGQYHKRVGVGNFPQKGQVP